MLYSKVSNVKLRLGVAARRLQVPGSTYCAVVFYNKTAQYVLEQNCAAYLFSSLFELEATKPYHELLKPSMNRDSMQPHGDQLAHSKLTSMATCLDSLADKVVRCNHTAIT